MNPILDQVIVGLTIAAAIGWLVWRSLRRKSGKACGGGCGCATKPVAK